MTDKVIRKFIAREINFEIENVVIEWIENKENSYMDVKSEEIFSSEEAPLNRSNFALGVYQNVVYLYGGECNFSGSPPNRTTINPIF